MSAAGKMAMKVTVNTIVKACKKKKTVPTSQVLQNFYLESYQWFSMCTRKWTVSHLDSIVFDFGQLSPYLLQYQENLLGTRHSAQKPSSYLTNMAYTILLESFYAGLNVELNNWALSEIHLSVNKRRAHAIIIRKSRFNGSQI